MNCSRGGGSEVRKRKRERKPSKRSARWTRVDVVGDRGLAMPSISFPFLPSPAPSLPYLAARLGSLSHRPRRSFGTAGAIVEEMIVSRMGFDLRRSTQHPPTPHLVLYRCSRSDATMASGARGTPATVSTISHSEEDDRKGTSSCRSS